MLLGLQDARDSLNPHHTMSFFNLLSTSICIASLLLLNQHVALADHDDENPLDPFEALGECGLDCLAIGDKDAGLLDQCFHDQVVISPSNIIGRNDGALYDEARRTRQGYLSRYPQTVVYAQNANDVEQAVTCAVYGGYQVSASGGRHKEYGVLDGYVVIDTSNITFTAKHDAERNTLTVGAGYTHGMVVNALRDFAPSTAMLSIGNGGSVGFIGYMIGAGLGYASPAIGLGCDSIREIETVLIDGTQGVRRIRATTTNEYKDLLWSFCGGGWGLGIITEVTVQYTLADTTIFSYGSVRFETQDSLQDQAKMISNVLDFYASEENTYFGGQVWVGHKRFEFNGLFQGSEKKFQELMEKHSLSKYVREYDMNQTSKFPIASAHFVCRLMSFNNYKDSWDEIEAALSKLTGRDDLNSSEFTETGYCRNETILDALITLGGNRSSFVSNGLHPAWRPKNSTEANDWTEYSSVRSSYGKVRFIPLPSVNVLKTMLAVLEDHEMPDQNPLTLSVVRLASGKIMDKDPDETAFPWRNQPLMMRTPAQVLVPIFEILQEVFPSGQIGGYYGLSDSFDSNWQYTYFGNNYARAGSIRANYDPLNTFGKKLTPDQIFPTITNTPVGKKKKTRVPVASPVHDDAPTGVKKLKKGGQ